jgi:hypothetical protein
MFCFSLVFSDLNSAQASVNPGYKTYVFGPLTQVTDFTAFQNQLTTLKNNGVTGISSDMWWGLFEPTTKNTFDWSYYLQYARAVKAAGLQWVPIFSFHQCGGNVGDSCNIPLPSWVSSQATDDQLWYRDEYGDNTDHEYLSLWSGVDVGLYDAAMQSFKTTFNTSEFAGLFDSIHIGLGPSGELRYPSYHTGWTYPQRGRLQAYSAPAEADFQSAMQTKYSNSLSSLNTAWGTSLTAWTQISPPTDHDNFFTGGTTGNYGHDFLNWYQGALLNHMTAVMAKAHTDLDTMGVPLGAKIAGVHWLYTSPTLPHAAEYCAGYYNYDTIVQNFANTSTHSNADLDFTALEKVDENQVVNGSYEYSGARSLVIQVANDAKAHAVKIYGENALAIVNNTSLYDNVAQMLFNYGGENPSAGKIGFAGFFLLRLANIVNSDGSAVVNGSVNELASFADKIALKPIAFTFTVNNAPAVTSGRAVYLVGDRNELGIWDPYYYPTKMTQVSGTNNWTVTIYLGLSRTYNFKFIEKTGDGGSSTNIVWEGGSNHNYTTWNGTNSYNANWQN